ncbi:MAG: hypothetical protein ACFFED_14440 [Candidatus Thorarchaeota archaeon]
MLKLALLSAKSQHEFFVSTSEKTELPEVKALLLVLADSEHKMIAKIQHMIATGILDELEELKQVPDRDEIPDPTPFDPFREETDPRIFICNKSLDKALNSYKLYLNLATKAKSEVVSLLFEYLAYLKMHQIEQLRKICRTF